MYLLYDDFIPSFSNGRLFVVSAPSGAGKTTLCRIACKRIPGLVYSVSYTTRAPREGEINGLDYNFVSEEEFLDGIYKGDWIEWARVHGNLYGTSALFLRKHLAVGSSVLLDVDIQGAECILEAYPDAITVFVMPPSLEVLEKRLRSRGTDAAAVVEERLRNARLEIEKKKSYQYILINDNFEKTVNSFISVFKQNI